MTAIEREIDILVDKDLKRDHWFNTEKKIVVKHFSNETVSEKGNARKELKNEIILLMHKRISRKKDF